MIDLSALDCVVLDIDDTLYLERDYVRSGLEAAGSWLEDQVAVSGLAGAAWDLFERGARGRIFDDALKALGVTADVELIGSLIQVYRSHEPNISLLEDARKFLIALHGAVAISIISDGPAQSQHAKAEALGLRRWADPILLTDELGSGFAKPSPRAFELVERALGVRSGRCLYIGDNPSKDFDAARLLGWHAIRVRRQGGLYAHLDVTEDVPEVDDLTFHDARLEPSR